MLYLVHVGRLHSARPCAILHAGQPCQQRGTFREVMSPQPTLDAGRLQLYLTGKKTTNSKRPWASVQRCRREVASFSRAPNGSEYVPKPTRRTACLHVSRAMQ